MTRDQFITLLSAMLLAADRVQGAIWEASGDGLPREYKYSSRKDVIADAIALYDAVSSGTA